MSRSNVTLAQIFVGLHIFAAVVVCLGGVTAAIAFAFMGRELFAGKLATGSAVLGAVFVIGATQVGLSLRAFNALRRPASTTLRRVAVALIAPGVAALFAASSFFSGGSMGALLPVASVAFVAYVAFKLSTQPQPAAAAA